MESVKILRLFSWREKKEKTIVSKPHAAICSDGSLVPVSQREISTVRRRKDPALNNVTVNTPALCVHGPNTPC